MPGLNSACGIERAPSVLVWEKGVYLVGTPDVQIVM